MAKEHTREDIFNIMDETARTHEPIVITGKKNDVVMLSLEDYRAIKEMLYLNSIPNMVSSVQEAMKVPDSGFSRDIQW